MGVRVREKDGKWYCFISHKRVRRAKCFGAGKASKRAAEDAAVQIRAALARGDLGIVAPDRAQETPLATYAEKWLAEHARVYCQPAITAERVRSVVSGFLASNRVKASTMRTLIIPLRACLAVAVEKGLLSRNPTAGLVKLLKKRQGDDQLDPRELFTPEELERLVDVAQREMPEHAALILTLCRTGIRIGEALALQVDDLEFGSHPPMLWVRRPLSCGGPRVSDRPKGGKVRRIEMTPQLAEALRGQESLIQAEAVLQGREARWLFPQPGTEQRSSWFHRRVWTVLLRRAKLRPRKPHMIRHTTLSLLLQQGAPLPYVSEVAGHATPAVTASVYAHALPHANRGVMERLDRASERDSRATDPAPAVRVSLR